MPHSAASSPAQTRLTYAGIGSRATPPVVLDLMAGAARWLSTAGWVLRTGMATGADQAFYRGASTHGPLELYLPWPTFEAHAHAPSHDSDQFVLGQPTPAAYELAATFHPAWSRLPRAVRSLHATLIRCSAPTCKAQHASSCAGPPTAVSTAVGSVSAEPARRCASPTTTASPSSTSLAWST